MTGPYTYTVRYGGKVLDTGSGGTLLQAARAAATVARAMVARSGRPGPCGTMYEDRTIEILDAHGKLARHYYAYVATKGRNAGTVVVAR